MPKEIAEWAYNAWGDMRHWKASELELIPRWHEQHDDIRDLWRTAVRETLVRGSR